MGNMESLPLDHQGSPYPFGHLRWTVREGFPEEVTWNKDLDDGRSQPSDSLGENAVGQGNSQGEVPKQEQALCAHDSCGEPGPLCQSK